MTFCWKPIREETEVLESFMIWQECLAVVIVLKAKTFGCFGRVSQWKPPKNCETVMEKGTKAGLEISEASHLWRKKCMNISDTCP